MNKKLAGVIFIFNGNRYDYNYMESIKCLHECTDHVFIVAGGDDNTLEDIMFNITNDGSYSLIRISEAHWESKHGQEKLSYFTNIGIEAAEKAGYEYQFNLQADEILHEKSYPIIRKAIEHGCEAYMCTRINLWGDCYHKLVVPLNRMPCSTSIIRLAKTNCRSVGDAESLGTSMVDIYFESGIEIWHYGFVRKKEIMKDKIINMQCAVFQMEHYDQKLNECDVFNSKLWFDGDDLEVIHCPHPKIMKEWIRDRP